MIQLQGKFCKQPFRRMGWRVERISKTIIPAVALMGLLAFAGLAQAQLPDLVISNFNAPTMATAGQTIPITLSVMNRGAGPSSDFRVGLYLSKNPVLTPLSIFTNDVYIFLSFPGIPALAPGEEKTPLGASVMIPFDIVTGEYYIGAFADDTEIVVETNETNNSYTSNSGRIAITGRAPRTGVGVVNNGYWLLDFNGSYSWNAPPNGDRSFALGQPNDIPVVGDWNGTGLAKAGVFSNGQWLLDYDGDGFFVGNWPQHLDRVVNFGSAGDIPVVGDWNGDGRTKIGVYKNGVFMLDFNGDFKWEPGGADKMVGWGAADSTPVVGDWNGDGRTKIGVYKDGYWFLDYDGDYLWNPGGADKQVAWGWPGVERIVIGDWNGDGRTKLGVINLGFWFLDYNGNFVWEPGGADKQTGWGWPGVEYVTGDWNNDGRTKIGVVNLGFWFLDYDGNYFWDGGSTDIILGWGAPGDTPITGRW